MREGIKRGGCYKLIIIEVVIIISYHVLMSIYGYYQIISCAYVTMETTNLIKDKTTLAVGNVHRL